MKICIYCSSSDYLDPKYYQLAADLASEMAKRNHSLVYGGASVGVMGVLADKMLEKNKEVLGIIPKVIADKKIAHKNLTELIETSDMSERKKMLQQKADAFITLPGGFGTLEELSETLTAKQLEFYDKPIVILNQDSFYDPLLKLFENYYQHNFARSDYKNLYLLSSSINETLDYIENYKKSDIESKWYRDNLKL